MNIISLQFLLFLLLSSVIYYLIPKKIQYIWLLIISIYYYFILSLKGIIFIAVSILSTYIASIVNGSNKYKNNASIKKMILVLTLLINIGTLVYLKYCNFTIISFNKIFLQTNNTFNLIIPIGISFYTLQVVGYCIDVYRSKYKPEKNILKYSLFVLFFPHILQGPIARFDQLADQLYEKHYFDLKKIKYGIQLMIYGFFKKMVIADRCAILVNEVFNNYKEYEGFQILVASLFYTIQLYADFSGCVDIMRGCSEIFGIKLSTNFDRPYLSSSIKEFWRKWHISLSNWLRDYIYIPLGGNRKGNIHRYINLLIVFLISGFWHGVGFHYIVWGLIHGFYQVIGEILLPLRKKIIRIIQVNENTFSYKLYKIVVTFLLVNFAWIFFRADSLRIAIIMIKSMITTFNPWIFFDNSLYTLGLNQKNFNVVVVSILIMLLLSILQSKYRIRDEIEKQHIIVRWILYIVSIFFILYTGIYGPGYNANEFIYSQF